MSNFTKFVICMFLIAYVLSPVDLMPGVPLDDIVAIIALIKTNKAAIEE